MQPFETAVTFIRSIGIPVIFRKLSDPTFLPGLQIDGGCILVDKQQLQHPGDLLHEAGHIAVVPPAERTMLRQDNIGGRENHAAEEMMAIAWSFAACKHLKIDPAFVFHEQGYKGEGRNIAEQFEAGHTFGVPMLQWAGMTAEPHQSKNIGLAPYPLMSHWLRPL
ncbi:hypothetical protein CK934_21205 [Chitinophaga sp. MD30]|nr:hypothetical protein CK934_21205 [Chitinophaga sp. MD30]